MLRAATLKHPSTLEALHSISQELPHEWRNMHEWCSVCMWPTAWKSVPKLVWHNISQRYHLRWIAPYCIALTKCASCCREASQAARPGAAQHLAGASAGPGSLGRCRGDAGPWAEGGPEAGVVAKQARHPSSLPALLLW